MGFTTIASRLKGQATSDDTSEQDGASRFVHPYDTARRNFVPREGIACPIDDGVGREGRVRRSEGSRERKVDMGGHDELPRSLLGYQRAAVDQILADKDSIARLAQNRAQQADAMVTQLERELEAAREEFAKFRAQAHDEPRPRFTFLAEELGLILRAAEEAASRIFERAKTEGEVQLKEADEVWSHLQDKVSSYTAWLQEAEPLFLGALNKAEHTQSEIRGTPERLHQEARQVLDHWVGGVREGLWEAAEDLAPPDSDPAPLGSASAIEPDQEEDGGTGHGQSDDAGLSDTFHPVSAAGLDQEAATAEPADEVDQEEWWQQAHADQIGESATG